STASLRYFLDRLTLMCGILGLDTAGEKARADASLEARVEKLISARQEARKARDFAEADRIRNELSDMGVVIEDKPEGARWSFRKK
ncbi:MAG: hypothetical protein FWF44_08615, partial [Defluviitaleaceae bacterium]|nr:hypothetical protein [Defluviitaleaceae bacterium]